MSIFHTSHREDAGSVAGTGHFLAEEFPEELLTALTAFLAPYRDAAAKEPVAAA